MIKVLNIGSINIDYVYQMKAFVKAGETVASTRMDTYLGGKGANQSVALAKAGVAVRHAGNIAKTDGWIIDQLSGWGVDTRFIFDDYETTGHAIIQVDSEGENAIFLHGGANLEFTESQIIELLSHYNKGDILILQNEINLVPFIIKEAHKRGLQIFVNPAPMTHKVKSWPLEMIDFLVINESEGAALSGKQEDKEIIDKLLLDYPDTNIIYTMGSNGSIYTDKNQQINQAAEQVMAVDTTSAGDTFIGYFIAGIVRGLSIRECLEQATKASAVTVTRAGGAVSIPLMEEL